MRSRSRHLAAAAGAVTMLKTAEALGVAPVLAAHGAQAAVCNTNAYVQYSVPMTVPGTTGPQYGTTNLWYSAACRSVAAQIVAPRALVAGETGLGDLHKEACSYANCYVECSVPTGASKCSTDYVNDANTRAYADGRFYANNGSWFVEGSTPWW
jgi:hypothetical protein